MMVAKAKVKAAILSIIAFIFQIDEWNTMMTRHILMNTDETVFHRHGRLDIFDDCQSIC